MSVKPWTEVGRTKLQQTRVFSLWSRRMRSPDASQEDDYYYLDCPSWVNILALTPNQEVVLVEQFRHGVQQIGLEIPGGIVDPGEDPVDAAVRELREETGYTCSSVEPLGWVHPNPAIQNNHLYSFLAADARLTEGQDLDEHEDISVTLKPIDEIPQLLQQGKISHSLVVSAFAMYFTKQRGSLKNAND